MKSRTVIMLWTAAILLGITAYFVKFHHNDDNSMNTQLSPGDKMLNELPLQDLSSITLQQGQQKTTLTRGKHNQWTIDERKNYPANHTLLRNLLGALNQLQVTQGYACRNEHYGRFGVAETSDNASDVGIHISIKQSNGSPLTDLYLGKFNGGSQSSIGRFIRLANDSSGVYVGGESFPGIYADPINWLSPHFFSIEGIQSIHVSAPDDPAFTPWEISRQSIAAKDQFKLSAIKSNEVMKLTSTSKFRALFAHTSFQDVLHPDEAKTSANPDVKLKRLAVIKTFYGITYTITIWPQIDKPQPEPDPESPLPPVKAAYLLTISVDADLSTSRPKVEGESSEQAAENDLKFQSLLQVLKTTVAATESYQGKIYQVGHTMLAPLQMKRGDFISVKKPSTKAPLALPQASSSR